MPSSGPPSSAPRRPRASVYAIGSLGRGGATPLRLALAGAATSIAAASMTIAIVLPRNDIAGGVRAWQIGGVGGATYESLVPALPFFAAGVAISLLSARSLNLLALGDETAASLGERVAPARGASALGAVLLSGAATATCGPIGFVGLVVPHLCRSSSGSTTAGSCPSRPWRARSCWSPPMSWGASSHARPSSRWASSPPSSAPRSSSGSSGGGG
jgi:ABC-type Fe3+-siderophore transport system permease subunit